ncbi:transposase [Streptomyces albus]|uniref:transposase n=1 Tax=Streptomyces albus TaxID=1888 RepID=UPI000ABFF957
MAARPPSSKTPVDAPLRSALPSITAGQILVSRSHPGRFRSEAACAAFAGVAPIPASSGLISKHRLNRGEDRSSPGSQT